MNQQIDPSYAIIRYHVMLGKRTDPNPIAVLPPLCMDHYLLNYLPGLPYNLYHYLEGCNYFQRVLLSGEQTGLHVDFVFNDTIEDPLWSAALSKGLNVFLICTDDDDDIKDMNISLSRVCPTNCVFWIDKSKKDKFIMPKVIAGSDEFWSFLYDYSQPLMTGMDDPLAVPICASSVKFPYFRPANINFFTLSSALGNWGVGTTVNEKNEKECLGEKSSNAVSDINSFARQEEIVDIISQLFGLCQNAQVAASEQKQGFNDQIYPPILISAPYTTKDIRDFFKYVSREESSVLKSVDRIVEMEQTPNYCYSLNAHDFGLDSHTLVSYINFFQANRMNYLDIAGSLHCSFRFSPYLRLPLIGKSINTELSYVSAGNNKRLAYSKDKNAYDIIIHKIGETIAVKLLAPKTMKMLEKMPAQIVAITDLPIEWLDVDGVPLGFSHDVCRIPETPASGLLTHYGISRFAPLYTIPEDILSKTLVVYGCREDAFKHWQDVADIFVKKWGANSVICHSLDDFELAVKAYKPKFLIIDTHGDTDLANHQSFIFMGDEKVYPQDIASRGISAHLVFLSACNTAPCYNDVNTIANAMIEVGASAVTSSYLPLDVAESSVLYIRVLNMLAMAAKKNIHRNWLAFISHILRTSFIMSPMVVATKRNKPNQIDQKQTGLVNTLSMVFENRANIYRKLKQGEEVEGLKYDFTKIIPHYLMYTTIGRADLVEFEVAVKARRAEYAKLAKKPN